MPISDSVVSALHSYERTLQKHLDAIQTTQACVLPMLAQLEAFGVTVGNDNPVCISTESGEFSISLRGNIEGRRCCLWFWVGGQWTCDRDNRATGRHEFLNFAQDTTTGKRTWESVKWTQAFQQVTSEITGESKEDLIEKILLSIRDFLVDSTVSAA